MAIRNRAWRASIAAVALVCAANAALAAEDSGVHAFLSNLFGEAGQPAASPAIAVPSVADPFDRGISRRRVVRSRPVTIHRRTPTVVATGPGKPVKVSIFEDTTLRPGDAVMMEDGVRIFAGSRSWPYTKADFVSLAKSHEVSRDAVKTLTALNDLPRP